MLILKNRNLPFSLCCLLFVTAYGTNTTSAKEPAAKNINSNDQSTAEAPIENGQEATVQPTRSNADQVLRHAVFFSFKKEATEAQIDTIVNAFLKLPTKIPEIIDFQWGTNNSPENLNDGFTHCFLLTFKDEAGRDAYLPHPAHKEFGKSLGGLHEKVFVIDYWGTQHAPLEKELKHAVFFKFKDDATAEQIKVVEDAFAALPVKVPSIKAFEWGIDNSPEKHSAGFTHCFMVTFDSEEGRSAYLPHADHLAFVEILKPILDKPRVMDFWAEAAKR